MRSLFRRISAREEGFTLVELVTASALLMLVLVSMFTVFAGLQRFGARQASRSESTDIVRLAMERITKEVRQAKLIRTTSDADYLDMDTYINGVETRIIYDATSGTELRRTVGGNTLPVVERLLSTAIFGYSTDPATGATPSVVTVHLVVRPEKFSNDQAEIAIDSEVQLRNR